MTEQYYSMREVATIIKVAYLTVYRWVHAGKLPTSKVGKQYRISQTDLDNLLAKYKGENL